MLIYRSKFYPYDWISVRGLKGNYRNHYAAYFKEHDFLFLFIEEPGWRSILIYFKSHYTPYNWIKRIRHNERILSIEYLRLNDYLFILV
jgi:hypothetical protein